MYRKAYQNLLQWKNEEKGSCAIMIDGARRVGKSYLAQEFAKNEYESYILIDFFTAPDEVKELFRFGYAFYATFCLLFGNVA